MAARNLLTADVLRQSSDSYTELYNQHGLQVNALKSGRFEIRCGSTHTYAKNLRDVEAKLDSLNLHDFPASGQEVVAAINTKVGERYRFQLVASVKGQEQVVHQLEGSKATLAEALSGVVSVDLEQIQAGKRYAAGDNLYGGEYFILVPMKAEMLELEPSFSEPQMYEKQVFAKGQVLNGLHPATGELVCILVDEAYPNGAVKDTNGNIYSADDLDIWQFAIGKPAPETETAFDIPEPALYESSDLPSYNPVGVVKETAPMIGDLQNYDSILSASAGVISDFLKQAKKVALIDRSSLNKVTVTAVNDQGQATDGQVEWNVRISSPQYKRSSSITIPLVMKGGSIDLAKDFITSTGHKRPLTLESLAAHLGALASDEQFINRRSAVAKNAQVFPSTLKAEASVDALMTGIEKQAKTEGFDTPTMVKSYLEAAKWTEECYDLEFSDSAEAYADSVVEEFLAKAIPTLKREAPDYELPADQAGHDLWLTRNGHGSGFWDDKNTYPGTIGNVLTDYAKDMGEDYLYVTDNGELDFEMNRKTEASKKQEVDPEFGKGYERFQKDKEKRREGELPTDPQKEFERGLDQFYEDKESRRGSSKKQALKAEEGSDVEASKAESKEKDEAKEESHKATKKQAQINKQGLVVGVTNQNSVLVLDMDDTRGSFSLVGHELMLVETSDPVTGSDITEQVMEDLGDEATDDKGELSQKFWDEQDKRQEQAMNAGNLVGEAYYFPGVGDSITVGGKEYYFDLIGAGQTGVDSITTPLIDPTELSVIEQAWKGLHLKDIKDPVDYDAQLEAKDQEIADLKKSLENNPNDWDKNLLKRLETERKQMAEQVGTYSPEYEQGMEAEMTLANIFDKYPAKAQLEKAVKILFPTKPGKGKKSSTTEKVSALRIQPATKQEATKKVGGKKEYYRQDNIGSVKYTISYHDGVSKNRDGSDFYGIKLFKNKKDLAAFEQELLNQGYVYGKQPIYKDEVTEVSAAKKIATDDTVRYYWQLAVDLDESGAEEDGLDLEKIGSDAITDAALQIESNVMDWMAKNLGSVTNEGHSDNELLGQVVVDRNNKEARERILSALIDNNEESMNTGSGTLPFDPFDKVPAELAKVFNVSLSFSRVGNQPEDNTPDYSDEEKFGSKKENPMKKYLEAYQEFKDNWDLNAGPVPSFEEWKDQQDPNVVATKKTAGDAITPEMEQFFEANKNKRNLLQLFSKKFDLPLAFAAPYLAIMQGLVEPTVEATKKTAVAPGFIGVSVYRNDQRVEQGEPDYVKMTDDVEETISGFKAKYPKAEVTTQKLGPQEVIINIDDKTASKKVQAAAGPYTLLTQIKEKLDAGQLGDEKTLRLLGHGMGHTKGADYTLGGPAQDIMFALIGYEAGHTTKDEALKVVKDNIDQALLDNAPLKGMNAEDPKLHEVWVAEMDKKNSK